MVLLWQGISIMQIHRGVMMFTLKDYFPLYSSYLLDARWGLEVNRIHHPSDCHHHNCRHPSHWIRPSVSLRRGYIRANQDTPTVSFERPRFYTRLLINPSKPSSCRCVLDRHSASRVQAQQSPFRVHLLTPCFYPSPFPPSLAATTAASTVGR
jgi:hypothetical protein